MKRYKAPTRPIQRREGITNSFDSDTWDFGISLTGLESSLRILQRLTDSLSFCVLNYVGQRERLQERKSVWVCHRPEVWDCRNTKHSLFVLFWFGCTEEARTCEAWFQLTFRPQKWNLKAHMWYQLSPFPSSNAAIAMQHHPSNIHQSVATPRYSATPWYVLIQWPNVIDTLSKLFFLALARCLSAGLWYLRRTRLPRHDRGPVTGGNRSAASCLCTVLRRALYHYATRSPNWHAIETMAE